MKIDFLDLARQELDDAFDWYEAQAPGLGYDFLSEIDRAVRRILVYPQSAAIIETGLRRVLINRFPYGIIYGLDEDRVVVVAVAHLHREPCYWIDRIVYSTKPDGRNMVRERRTMYGRKRQRRSNKAIV